MSVSSRSAPALPVAPDTAAALREHIHDARDAYLEFLVRLVRAESPSTDPDAQAAVQTMLAEALDDLGFAPTQLPGTTTGGALYARPSGATAHAPRQLLLGHGDTVWGHGTLDQMPVEVDDDRVRGPGVFDMKGGLTSMIFALRALQALDLRPSATPLVLVTSDEEIGSPESKRHIDRLARVSERVFVLEPALGPEGKLKTARKGTGELTIIARASGTPPSGNVVLELSRLVQRLHALNDLERGVTVNVGTIDGRQLEGETASEGRLAVDVRVPTQADADRLGRVIHDFESETPGVSLTIQGGLDRPPMERTPGTARLWTCARRLGQQLGLDLEEGRSGGASDGNFTSQYAPTLDGLGAVGDGAHADHEYLDIEHTLDRCALLALLLLVPPQGEPSAEEGAQYSSRSS